MKIDLSFRLFWYLVLLSITSLNAKIESGASTSFKKPTIKQLFGCYKVALGSAMLVHTAYSVAPFFSINSDAFSRFFDSNYPTTLLTGFLGAHMVYFGFCDMLKRPTRSIYLKYQADLCTTIALVQSLKMSLKGLYFLKIKVERLLQRNID